MSNSKNSDWLSNYYNRTKEDCKTSFERRDRVTNWSYTVLIGILAIYFGFFGEGIAVPPIGRFALLAITLFVLTKFFFQSMIAYGFFLRSRYFRTKIEQHWMNAEPTLDQIKIDIKKYDHDRSMPPTGRNRFVGQIKSGFILVLIIPTILFGLELFWSGGMDLRYYAILVPLIAYVIFEIINFRSYDQMKTSKKN